MIKKLVKIFTKEKNLEIVKSYNNYEEYVKHQKEKTTNPEKREKWLNQEWEPKVKYFQETFNWLSENINDFKIGKSIGLGARTGQEIQAMINLGYEAIGVDLVPCEPLVIAGDIHNLPFENSSFDFIFSNIFDHALYPFKFLEEIKRISKPNGHVLLHLAVGVTDEYGVNELYNPKVIIDHFNDSDIILNEEMPTWGGLNYKLLIKINK